MRSRPSLRDENGERLKEKTENAVCKADRRPGRRYFGVDGERMGMKRVKEFVKRETVLTAAFLLAALSMVFVRPDRAYGGYVDA